MAQSQSQSHACVLSDSASSHSLPLIPSVFSTDNSLLITMSLSVTSSLPLPLYPYLFCSQVMIKWAITKGYSVMLPPSSSGTVGGDLSLFLDGTLPDEVMTILDLLDEGQVTGWETNEEGGGGDDDAE